MSQSSRLLDRGTRLATQTFEHCTNITFSKELIILGARASLVTDRIIDLCTFITEYHIFTSKLQGTTPHLNAFAQKIKNWSQVEKYYY